MGTNYYIRKAIRPSKIRELKRLVNEKDIYEGTLQEALDEFQEIHIGKSSCGWQFCFNHNNWKYYDQNKDSINAFIQRELSAGGSFINEYGDSITLEDFWKMVDSKREGLNQRTAEEQGLERHSSYPETITSEGLRFAPCTDFC